LYVDAVAKGKLDLSKITQFVKVPSITKLQGLLNADVAINGTAGAMQKQQLDKFNAKGNIDLSNFFYASTDYPGGVGLSNVNMAFTPKNLALNNLAGKFLQTSFSANGYINNILPYMFKNEPLQGVMSVKADNIDLDALMGVSTDTTKKEQQLVNLLLCQKI